MALEDDMSMYLDAVPQSSNQKPKKIPKFNDYLKQNYGGVELLPQEYNKAVDDYTQTFADLAVQSRVGVRPKRGVTQYDEAANAAREDWVATSANLFPKRKLDTTFDKAANLAKTAASALVGFPKMFTDLTGTDSASSEYLDGIQKSLQKSQTPTLKIEQERTQAIRKAGEYIPDKNSTFLDDVVGYANEGINAAKQISLNEVVGGVTSIIPQIGLAMATGGAGNVAVKAGALTRAAANIAQKSALGAAGAAQGVGALKGDIAEAVQKAAREQGYTEEQANELGNKASEYGSIPLAQQALAGVLGSFGAVTGAEKPFVGNQALVNAASKSALTRIGTGAATEKVEEFGQTAQSRYAQNQAKIALELSNDPVTTGIFGEGFTAGLIGAGTGAATNIKTPGGIFIGDIQAQDPVMQKFAPARNKQIGKIVESAAREADGLQALAAETNTTGDRSLAKRIAIKILEQQNAVKPNNDAGNRPPENDTSIEPDLTGVADTFDDDGKDLLRQAEQFADETQSGTTTGQQTSTPDQEQSGAPIVEDNGGTDAPTDITEQVTESGNVNPEPNQRSEPIADAADGNNAATGADSEVQGYGQVATFKPNETGNKPNTEAINRGIAEIEAEGFPVNAQSAQIWAENHYESYQDYIKATGATESANKQVFIDGTVENMLATARLDGKELSDADGQKADARLNYLNSNEPGWDKLSRSDAGDRMGRDEVSYRKELGQREAAIKERNTPAVFEPETQSVKDERARLAAITRQRKANLRNSTFKKSPFLAFLGTTGIALDLKSEFSPDKNPMLSGYGPLFRRTGTSLDLLANRAVEAGFMPIGSENDTNTLSSLIEAQLRGDKIYPLYGQDGEASIEQIAAERAKQDFEDAQAELKAAEELQELEQREYDALVISFETDMLELPAINDQSSMSMEDALLAIGYTQEEANAEFIEQARIEKEASASTDGANGIEAGAAPEGNGGRNGTPSSPTPARPADSNQPGDAQGLIAPRSAEGRNNATTAPDRPAIYTLANGRFARYEDGIWYRGENTPQKALKTEMVSADLGPEDRGYDQAWTLYAEFTVDEYGAPKSLKRRAASETLTSPTRQDVLDQQDRKEKADKAEAKAKADAEKKAKAEREAEEIKKAGATAADRFVLGGNAEEELSGQGGMFNTTSSFATSQFTTAFGSEPAIIADAMAIAKTLTPGIGDIDFSLQRLPDGVPARYNRTSGEIELSDRHSFTQDQLVEVLIEERLHALDSISPEQTISGLSQTFLPGGAAYEAAKDQYSNQDGFGEYLSYPMADARMSSERTAAELFARIGVLFSADPARAARFFPTLAGIYDVRPAETYAINEQLRDSIPEPRRELRRLTENGGQQRLNGITAQTFGRIGKGQQAIARPELAEHRRRIAQALDADIPALRTAKPNGQGGIRFSKTTAEKDLIVQHNLTAENLLFADRMGGLAVPSVAITKADTPMQNFGEITLLGDRDMADPKRGIKAFGADIYSPRYPQISYQLDKPALARLNAALAPYRNENAREIYSGEITRVDDLTADKAFKAYADPDGRSNWSELKEKAVSLLQDAGATERLFQGFTNSGNRKYKPHTLENVIAILKKELRGGENFNYGAGSLRAKFTPQFRSIEAIKKAKGALVSTEQFEAVKDEVNNELLSIAEALKKPTDTAIAIFEDAPRMGLKRAAAQYNIDLGDEMASRMAEFLTRLKNMPTEYFEGKFLRSVAISEFKAAVVPEGVKQSALDLLAREGVKVYTYKKGDAADRARVTKEAATQTENGIFSQAPATTNPSNPTAIQAAIERIFGGMKDAWARVSQNTVVINSDGITAEMIPVNDKAARNNAQAFYLPSKVKGEQGKIYLIADRIEAGTEASVWLHEVFHKRGEELLGKESLKKLHGNVLQWKSKPTTSVERQIYEAANKRATDAATGANKKVDQKIYEAEFLPYAIEEANNRGVTPDASKGTITAAGWLAKIKSLFEGALRKLTNGLAGKIELSASDLMAMAYGAAGLEYQYANVFRDGHVAPGAENDSVEVRKDTGGNFSLAEIAQGFHNQPDDYFDTKVGARYYGYESTAGRESQTAINNLIRQKKAKKELSSITIYRAVPKDSLTTRMKNGDWVSLSKTYAIQHGSNRFGKYSIIEQTVSPGNVWWDGNDINEFGYDDSLTAGAQGRGVVATSNLKTALQELSQSDELFALPKSNKTDIQGIILDNSEAVSVKTINTPLGITHKLTLPDGTIATISERKPNPYGQSLYGYELKGGEMVNKITERPGENPDDVPPTTDVWLDVSKLKTGENGALAYNIAATYAHNNGMIFIGDPAGLSDAALRRRTEQMISSALKFGTTDHLAPHPRQVQGDSALGVSPLQWVYGDSEGNIQRMIDVSEKSLENAFPTSQLIAYKDGNFYRTDTGQVFRDREQLEIAIKQSISSRFSLEERAKRTGQSGWRSVVRAALFRSLAQPNRESDTLQQGTGTSKILDRLRKELPRLRSGQTESGTSETQSRIFYSERPSLAATQQIARTGKLPKGKTDRTEIQDALITKLTDSTRPFDVWTRDLPDQGTAAAMISAKNRASGIEAAFNKQVMIDFGKRVSASIGQIVKAGKLNKNPIEFDAALRLAGDWMSATYAPIANQNLLKKDKAALQEALTIVQADDTAANRAAVNRAKDVFIKRQAAIIDPRIIDPVDSKLKIGLAGGYNNATAKQAIADIEAKIDRQLLEATANIIYEMNAFNLKESVRLGKVTQEIADTFDKSGKYVPLTGDPRADDSAGDVFGTGSTNQSKDRAMMGRTSSLAQNGIDASFEQIQKTARYRGWADFKDELHQMFESAIVRYLANGDTQQQAQRKASEDLGINRAPETLQRPSDDVIIYRKNGQAWVYDLNSKDAIDALRSAQVEPIPSALKYIGIATRTMSRLVTQFMPGFAAVNAMRDVWEKSENIRTRILPNYPNLDMNKVSRDMLANSAATLGKLHKAITPVVAEGTPLQARFKLDKTNSDQALLIQFLSDGGGSTWGDFLSADGKALAEKLANQHTALTKGMEIVEVWNNSWELISGFAAYKSLTENGVDGKSAANMALELMNFRKGGTAMKPIKAVYMFAQPIATGGHQLLKTLATRRGKARFTAYMLAGMALYALLRSGEDDDELGINHMDETSSFQLERNVVIKYGTEGKSVNIPIGFGLPMLAWGYAVNLDKMLLGKQTALETAAEMAKLHLKTFAPVAPSEASISQQPLIWLTQSATPSVLKPLVNVALDRTAFGQALTNQMLEKPDKANALEGRNTTPEMYKDIAQFMAGMGMDMYPETVREIIKGYGVGPINEALKAWIDNPAKEARGKEQPSVFIDRVIKMQNREDLISRIYYREREQLNAIGIKQSLGRELNEQEQKMFKLLEEVKKEEGSARGIKGAATRMFNVTKNQAALEAATKRSNDATAALQKRVITRMNIIKAQQ